MSGNSYSVLIFSGHQDSNKSYQLTGKDRLAIANQGKSNHHQDNMNEKEGRLLISSY